MKHPEPWYAALAARLDHPGYVTLAEVRQQEAREARKTAATAKWKHHPGGPYYTEIDSNIYVIYKNGRKWRIEAGPVSLSPRYTRYQDGIATLADAKNLALNMPCFRCGLGSPLVLMTPCLPARPSLASDPGNRWKCMDTGPCEAERKRLTDTEDDPPARIEISQPAPGQRLEYLRASLRAENISYGELIELQSLAPHISPGDTELLEAAGVPEHPEN